MKKLLLFIFIINLTATAQDSTSLSFGTETVDEFKKQNLMDEYERAFGGVEKVNTRLKAGFMDFNSFFGGPTLPFVGIEQRIGKRLNLNIGGIISNRSYFGFYSFNPFQEKAKFKISAYAELKYYFKANSILSGNYLGLEYKNIDETPGFGFGESVPYFSKNHFTLKIGKQFRSSVDIGLQVGLKNIGRLEVDKEGFSSLNHNPEKPYMPFISTYSKIGVGVDLPWVKKPNDESCNFLNCYSEFKSLFKVNLSNILYIDQFYKNIKLDLTYERKLGKLPISINLDLVTSIFSYKILEDSGQMGIKTTENGYFSYPIYKQDYKTSKNIGSVATLQFRYYLLQNRNIATGKAVSNLSGLYTGLYSSRHVTFTTHFNTDGGLKRLKDNGFMNNSGLSIGLQKKILKNYYYDFSIHVPFKSNLRVENVLMPGIKFGYAF